MIVSIAPEPEPTSEETGVFVINYLDYFVHFRGRGTTLIGEPW